MPTVGSRISEGEQVRRWKDKLFSDFHSQFLAQKQSCILFLKSLASSLDKFLEQDLSPSTNTIDTEDINVELPLAKAKARQIQEIHPFSLYSFQRSRTHADNLYGVQGGGRLVTIDLFTTRFLPYGSVRTKLLTKVKLLSTTAITIFARRGLSSDVLVQSSSTHLPAFQTELLRSRLAITFQM